MWPADFEIINDFFQYLCVLLIAERTQVQR